jgi:secreted trypsin-like serine protease
MNFLGRASFGTVCALALVAAIAVAPAGASKKEGPVAGKSIIAGIDADPAQWPYMAAVYRKGRLHCGGSVIAPTKVLTAAHCVEGFDPTKLTVVTGRPNLRDRTVGQEIGVATAVSHPDYKVSQVHDTGIITLVSPTSAPPIALPTPEEGPILGQPGQTLRVAGWGARNPFGFRLANVLKTTTEVIRTARRCKRTYRRLFEPVAMICSLGARLKGFGRPAIHTTACTGDSGGPLVADTALGPKIVGTVSFGGAFCGLGASPTVYSRVSDSLPFINQYG